MSDDKDKPHLRLIQKVKDQRMAEQKKVDQYKKRSNTQKDFYANARIATVSIEYLKEALLTSVVLDENGEVIVEWTEELVDSLLNDVKDPGPRKRY